MFCLYANGHLNSNSGCGCSCGFENIVIRTETFLNRCHCGGGCHVRTMDSGFYSLLFGETLSAAMNPAVKQQESALEAWAMVTMV